MYTKAGDHFRVIAIKRMFAIIADVGTRLPTNTRELGCSWVVHRNPIEIHALIVLASRGKQRGNSPCQGLIGGLLSVCNLFVLVLVV